MRRRILPLVVLCCAFGGGQLAANWFPYDVFPVGVKNLSLGGAFVSLADDASAVAVNPAGLVQLEQGVFSYQLLSQVKLQRLVDSSIKLDWEFLPLVACVFPVEEGSVHGALSLSTLFRSLSGRYGVHVLGASVSWKILPRLAWGNTVGLAIGSADDEYAYGLFWQTGLLAPVSDRVRLGLVARFPVALEWDALRGDTSVRERLPLTLQGGVAWKTSETSILSAELEFIDVAGIRYSSFEGAANPAQPTGLFRNVHPHVGFQFLHRPTGAELRFGFMTFTHSAAGSVESQPALTLGLGAWTSKFFRIDFALLDTLIFDIFTRTNRYERFSLSFEYVM